MLVATLFLGGVTVREAWAQTSLYVRCDPIGNDQGGANNCQTEASPCRTLTNALTHASAADTINVALFGICEAANGEVFPLALKDGVAIIGDLVTPPTAPAVQIEAPGGTAIFHNDGTSALSSSTRLAGFTLTYHTRSDGNVFLEFDLAGQPLSPRIDHNYFWGNAPTNAEVGIGASGAAASANTFSPTIDNNTFNHVAQAILVEPGSGPGATYAPTVDANVFQTCGYPVYYDVAGAAAGTIAGSVIDNQSTRTTGADVYFGIYSRSTPEIAISPTISGNTFSSTRENIEVSFNSFAPSGDVTFSPTIANNSLTTTGGCNFDASSGMNDGTGNVTFAPVLRDNPVMSATHHNVSLSVAHWGVDGNVSHSPTITDNAMSGTRPVSVYMWFWNLSATTPTQENIVSPTITANTMTSTANDGVFIQLLNPGLGRFVSDMTISGNTITSPGNVGVMVVGQQFQHITGLDWALTISNNTITDAGHSGIDVSQQSGNYVGNGSFDFVVEGNTIDNPTVFGLVAYPGTFGAGNATDVAALVRGNTITGAGADGMVLSFTNQTGNTLEARIADNVITGSVSNGLDLYSDAPGSNGILVACNTITGNRWGIWQESGSAPPADFGGGNLSSPGNNILMGNTDDDFGNSHEAPVSAKFNYWGVNDAPTIDSNIYDDNEYSGSGAVDFSEFLYPAPTVTVTADLTDAVVNDVAPPGPSIGDTLQYTATLTPGASCGDTALTFACDAPANTTLVPGSVTASKGTVTGTDPITVAIGFVPAGEAVTISWQEVVDSGTEVSCQGAITGDRSGNTLTDDPETTPDPDPTVTALAQQQEEVIPTLGQWGLLVLAAGLLLLGVAFLRRRNLIAAGLVLVLAAGSGWVVAATRHAAARGGEEDRTTTAATVKSATLAGDMLTLALSDGTTLTVPRHELRVWKHRTDPDYERLQGLRPEDQLIELSKVRTERQAQRAAREAELQAMTAEQRDLLRRQDRLQRLQRVAERRQERHARQVAELDPMSILAPGTPIVLDARRDGHGAIRHARIEACESEQQAHDVLQTRLAQRKGQAAR